MFFNSLLSVAMSGSVGVLAAETDGAAIGATARSTLAQSETGDRQGITSAAGLARTSSADIEAAAAQPFENIHGLFIEAGLLIKNTASTPEISTVSQFIEPRQASVRSGELTRFNETELTETTDIFGNVAHRFNSYAKSGTMKGVPFAVRGMISTQFILTPAGWKMSSMAWGDERPGLSIPEHYEQR